LGSSLVAASKEKKPGHYIRGPQPPKYREFLIADALDGTAFSAGVASKKATGKKVAAK
jgi:hypothetical protein